MGMYPTPPGDSLEPLVARLRKLESELRDLQRPTGTSLASLYDQVQQALANITATVTAAIQALSYTKAEINTKIASPGAIAPTSVTASGEISAGGKVRGGNLWGNTLSLDYRVVYVSNPSGELGHVPSSRRFKTSIKPAALDLNAVLGLELQTFKYKQAIEAYGSVEAAPMELGLIAEEVEEAGLDYLVYRGENGEVDGVAYERLGLPLLALAKRQQEELNAQSSRIAALEAIVLNAQLQ